MTISDRSEHILTLVEDVYSASDSAPTGRSLRWIEQFKDMGFFRNIAVPMVLEGLPVNLAVIDTVDTRPTSPLRAWRVADVDQLDSIHWSQSLRAACTWMEQSQRTHLDPHLFTAFIRPDAILAIINDDGDLIVDYPNISPIDLGSADTYPALTIRLGDLAHLPQFQAAIREFGVDHIIHANPPATRLLIGPHGSPDQRTTP